MKAVISHSKVSATSAALSFLSGAAVRELLFSVVSGDISKNPAGEQILCPLIQDRNKNRIMPVNPIPVNKNYFILRCFHPAFSPAANPY